MSPGRWSRSSGAVRCTGSQARPAVLHEGTPFPRDVSPGVMRGYPKGERGVSGGLLGEGRGKD